MSATPWGKETPREGTCPVRPHCRAARVHPENCILPSKKKGAFHARNNDYVFLNGYVFFRVAIMLHSYKNINGLVFDFCFDNENRARLRLGLRRAVWLALNPREQLLTQPRYF